MILKIVLFLSLVGSVFADPVTISGTILNPAGNPVKKAVVTLRNMKDNVLMEEKTSRKGKFSFKEVEPNFYFLVIEHEGDGAKRIKINPRKTRNADLELSLELTGDNEPTRCYLFSNDKPTDFDPILNVRDLNVQSSTEQIIITWKDIKQAQSFILFENDIELYRGEETRFEKNEFPGKEFCYSVEALGGFGLMGERSDIYCTSVTTAIPRDIVIDVSKNTLSLNWAPVNGALSYVIYRNDEKIINSDKTNILDSDLDFGMEYFYKITALDALDQESHPSVAVKGTTRDFVEPPILSSMKNDSRIILIWNEVKIAKSYNIYREGELLSSAQSNTFSDDVPSGKKYCYEITSIDQFGVESSRSNSHCAKVPIQSPTGVIADGGVTSMYLNWDEVSGAANYKVYEKVDQDSLLFINQVKSTQFTVQNLDYGADKCYQISALDSEGEETELSSSACNVVLDPPHFTIQKMTLIEPSGNSVIDSRETGILQFARFNDGQSPAHQVKMSIISHDSNQNLLVGKPAVLDTLEAGRIKFGKISLEGLLQVETGEHEFELQVSSINGIILDDPYLFKVETKSVIPPKMIVADFAIANDFGTHYIPINEIVNLIIRIQNVGEGESESVHVKITENRSFTTPDFTGNVSLPAFNPGDYMDIEVPIMSFQHNFSVDIELTDYLNRTVLQRLNLEAMKHYRSSMELITQSIGTEDVDHYPDELGEIDVDRRIPLGRKNPNAMAIILATEHYEDGNYPQLDYATRDGDVVRKYFNHAFGLSDFQLLPSKTWQMEGGPTENDFRNIFDPHQGSLRKRIITAEKYSDVDEMDIFLYYRGYGEWVNGKPLLIPKDAKVTRHITKYPLEQLVSNLSLLSVLGNIRSITLFLDITYINPKKSVGSIWDFPKMSNKICILSAASNGESSQVYKEKKHSIFSYTLLKGLAGGADDGDNLLELGELTEYIYKAVPEYARTVSNSSQQNPSFKGTDLKRIILDLR